MVVRFLLKAASMGCVYRGSGVYIVLKGLPLGSGAHTGICQRVSGGARTLSLEPWVLPPQ